MNEVLVIWLCQEKQKLFFLQRFAKLHLNKHLDKWDKGVDGDHNEITASQTSSIKERTEGVLVMSWFTDKGPAHPGVNEWISFYIKDILMSNRSSPVQQINLGWNSITEQNNDLKNTNDWQAEVENNQNAVMHRKGPYIFTRIFWPPTVLIINSYSVSQTASPRYSPEIQWSTGLFESIQSD